MQYAAEQLSVLTCPQSVQISADDEEFSCEELSGAETVPEAESSSAVITESATVSGINVRNALPRTLNTE